ncbi:thioredoxin family protein [Flavobacteriaceae bacterium F08102]|nr:thioredoxin family protein [Flavobacteriaceae bacterium F08102]
MKKIITICALIFFVNTGFCQSEAAPKSADAILKAASAKAAKENKNVFIIFHASWCGWCKKMDAKMADPAIKSYFDDNYVIDHLVVLEAPDKKNLENPGASELMAKYKANRSGIPFFLIFNPAGELLEDSFNSDMKNIGCPAQPEEIEEFARILKTTSKLKKNEIAEIAAKFAEK